MSIEYLGLSSINGPLVVLEGVLKASFEEIVEMKVNGTQTKLGRIIQLDKDKAVIQVFENTSNMSLTNTHTRLTGRPMEIALSEDILGRVFNGLGQPIDGLGDIVSDIRRDVNGKPMNPVRREYPRNYIRTGISAIDGLTTLIRGQKLPIFSGNGLPHDQLAAQIVKQASLAGGGEKPTAGGALETAGKSLNAAPDGGNKSGTADSGAGGTTDGGAGGTANGGAGGTTDGGGSGGGQFAVVFAAMGVKHDVAEFFRRTFEESGASSHVVTYLNLANDPVAERIITPKVALTAAEYLAFDKGYHVLVILTDMTSYAEALREISSSKGEIPSRKGYPGYLYSELAALYERAGIIAGTEGSVTQIPILTMPGDDITHPIPDLTGYITEGQIVLDRALHQQGIYPPINVLPSLSRLMKDGIGEGFTREDHQDVANQLFSAYAKVGEARALDSVIGEDELSPSDKKYLAFGKAFENEFVGQDIFENRTIYETLDIGWRLLRMLPKDELDRIDTKILNKYYDSEATSGQEPDNALGNAGAAPGSSESANTSGLKQL